MISFTAFSSLRRLRVNAATSFFILSLSVMLGVNSARAQAFTESWDTAVPGTGWVTQNNSVPVGSSGWFQGNPTVFTGQTSGYIGANFNNTTGTNTISNWLISPNRTFSNGDVIKFWTRTITANPFPDRLQVRMSLNGTSTNVGTGPAGLGDFTTLLYDIDPTYDTSTGPPPAMYPDTWTEITLTISGLASPTSGRIAFRYFVELGGPAGDNSNYIGIDTFSYTPGGASTPAADQVVDFNDDGKTDYAVVRNAGGGSGGQITWYINQNGVGGTQAFAWGISTDFFLAGDYDGDGKDDITVYRPTPGTFYILNSSNFTARVENFGQPGDDPTIVGDYNGDGTDDIAVYRDGASPGQQSVWYYRTAPNGPVTYAPWGLNGDFPVPGDFDGNGATDLTVQRTNGSGGANFWTRLSTGVVQPVVSFGLLTDLILPGDYDGDGKTDICVARSSGGQILWIYRASSTGAASPWILWGTSATDFPTQGDYDGDGRTDMAIWRPSATPNGSAFWVRSVASGAASSFALGANGDYPVANFDSH